MVERRLLLMGLFSAVAGDYCAHGHDQCIDKAPLAREQGGTMLQSRRPSSKDSIAALLDYYENLVRGMSILDNSTIEELNQTARDNLLTPLYKITARDQATLDEAAQGVGSVSSAVTRAMAIQPAGLLTNVSDAFHRFDMMKRVTEDRCKDKIEVKNEVVKDTCTNTYLSRAPKTELPAILMDCSIWYNNTRRRFLDEQVDCNISMSALNSTLFDVRTRTEEFQVAMCEAEAQLALMCNGYQEMHRLQREYFKNISKIVLEAVPAREKEYEGVILILCYIDILGSKTSVEEVSNMMMSCLSESIDTSPMRITEPDVVPVGECTSPELATVKSAWFAFEARQDFDEFGLSKLDARCVNWTFPEPPEDEGDDFTIQEIATTAGPIATTTTTTQLADTPGWRHPWGLTCEQLESSNICKSGHMFIEQYGAPGANCGFSNIEGFKDCAVIGKWPTLNCIACGKTLSIEVKDDAAWVNKDSESCTDYVTNGYCADGKIIKKWYNKGKPLFKECGEGGDKDCAEYQDWPSLHCAACGRGWIDR